jgi:hypothetical protein
VAGRGEERRLAGIVLAVVVALFALPLGALVAFVAPVRPGAPLARPSGATGLGSGASSPQIPTQFVASSAVAGPADGDDPARPLPRVEHRRVHLQTRPVTHRSEQRLRLPMAVAAWSVVLALVFLGLLAEAPAPRRLGRTVGAAPARAPPFVG